jgi:TonB-linked SusC/RagA family outer membrane protein
LITALLLAAVLPAGAYAQATGVVTGTVTAAENGAAISAANVTVGGTSIRTVTDAEGRYRVSVPAGQYSVQVSTIGRQGASRVVSVAAGQTATANFSLSSAAVALEGLTVTVTGVEQRTREVGVSVPRINIAQDVPLAATNDLAQVLQGRAPGVSVLSPGGTTGTGARIRIRGSNSVSLSNDPLLIVDGVRADNGNGNSIAVGGQTPNRLNDINPEDIESIDVLKGPAASALYGTAAANGVLVVTTRRGRSGPTRWSFYTEQGRITDPNNYPTNYKGFCTYTVPSGALAARSGSLCTPQSMAAFLAGGIATAARMDSVQSFNPLEDPRTTIIEDGSRSKYGLNMSGGSDRTTFFVSADLENEVGVYGNLNELDRVNLRANLGAQVRSDLHLAVNTGYINSNLGFPQNDNNVLGLLPSAYLGGATQSTAYGFFVRDDISALSVDQDVQRFMGSVTAAFKPTSWLSLNSTTGMDLLGRRDYQLTLPNRLAFGDAIQGNRRSNYINIYSYTATGSGTANYPITGRLTGQTTLGGQFDQQVFRGTYAFGRGLPAGCTSLNCAATGFSVDEVNSDSRTIGGFARQQISFADRLFLAASVRGDDVSTAGQDYGFIWYPAVDASWVVRDEPWFPELGFLSAFRLRAAYGESGLRPGFGTAETTLAPFAVTVAGVSVPALTLNNVGNLDLKPERTREFEMGVDLGLFDDRVTLELTRYVKRSEDALISRPLAPSLGISNLGQVINIGEVSNRGIEAGLKLQVLRGERFDWNWNITATRTRNRLEKLGIDPTTNDSIPPILFGLGGASQRFQQGYPLGGYFQGAVTFEDANNNQIIERTEVRVGEPEFLGSPFPTREASVQTNLTLFRNFRLSGLLDYRGGFKNYNSTAEFRCGSTANCATLYTGYPGVPTASLAEQAAAVAAVNGDAVTGIKSAAGFIEDGSFVKLRELSLTVGLPQSIARRTRARGASITFAGRNLKTWTDYTGLDPEINTSGSGSNFVTAEFLTQPPVRYYTARIDLNF